MGIVIQLTGTKENPEVKASGYNTEKLTDSKFQDFGYKRSWINQFYKTRYGHWPDDVLFNSDEVKSRWGDQSYDKYNLKNCIIKMIPVSARIIENNTKPEALQKTTFDNSESDIPATYTVQVNKSVTSKISRSWDVGVSTTISQSINWEVGGDAVGGKIGGETSISVTASYNEGSGWEKEESLSYLSGAEVQVPPKKTAEAIVSVMSGFMKIQVRYLLSIEGHIWINYSKKQSIGKGKHHFHFRNIHDYTNPKKYSTETMNIDSYSEGSVQIRTLD